MSFANHSKLITSDQSLPRSAGGIIWQKSHWIDSTLSGGMNFKVQVRPGTKAGAAHFGNLFPLSDSSDPFAPKSGCCGHRQSQCRQDG